MWTHEAVAAWAMPKTMADTIDLLRRIHAEHNVKQCVLEQAGTHMAGNNASASCKFARHCGHIESALYCLGIPTVQVLPAKWQRTLGAMPKDKAERKQRIKSLMQTRYPYIPVTLLTADALGILTHAMEAAR